MLAAGARRFAHALSTLALLLGLGATLHGHPHLGLVPDSARSQAPLEDGSPDDGVGQGCSVCIAKAQLGSGLPGVAPLGPRLAIQAASPLPDAPLLFVARRWAPLAPRAPPLTV
jgi:hypothetical protein